MADQTELLPGQLERIYSARFGETQQYRNEVWKVLTRDFFQRWVAPTATVLDLGCGYGEFVNNIRCSTKYGMDLNPEVAAHLASGVRLLAQDCSAPWELADDTVDVVFTSNFFEHLPDKEALSRTLAEARRCLRQGGRLIAMGPNIRYLPGQYWDFFDHYLPLTELSLAEGMRASGFQTERAIAKFLPFTLVNSPQYPLVFLRAYLAMPFVWKLRGKQFLVIAQKA